MTTLAPIGVAATSLSAVATGTGTAFVIPFQSENTRVNIKGVGVVTGGILVIEEAADPAYTGTWSQLYSINFATTVLTDSQQIVHIMGKLTAMRARITSNVTGGGTITVEFVAG